MLPEQKDSSGLAVKVGLRASVGRDLEPRKRESRAGERSANPGHLRWDFPPQASERLTDRQIGRYLVGGRLGSGGAASVYQAYDQIQGRSVALKILLPGADAAVRSRFRQEARTVASLRHPHIVQTLQVGDATNDGSAYIAMELIEGESLAQLLKRRGRLRVAESCNLLAPIARALDYAHQQGIIHRDVKPSNILLRPNVPAEPDSRLDSAVAPLLSDFGIALALDMPELTDVGRTIGTPAYMAPEQCVGRWEVTGRADIYSLGAALFRCLVGRAPFSGTTTQILHAHVYAPLSIPDDLLGSLPAAAVDVLRRSLAKKPEDRYASAREMAVDLAAIAGRTLPQEAGPAEVTSTLTLVSLPSIGLPPPQPHTETVIVPAGESQPDAFIQTAVPEEPITEERATFAEPEASPRARVRLLTAVLGGVFIFALLAGIGVAARNFLLGRPSQVSAAITTNATARPLPSPTDEPQPTKTEAAGVLAAAASTRAIATPEPTATDPPPALSEEPACQYVVAAEFNQIISENARRQLGCPKDVPISVTYKIQHFENGRVFGRQDKPIVYIRYASNQEWEQREHDWRPGMQESNDAPELRPPAAGLFQPLRGIGQIWAESIFVRQALGWAIDQAEETSGVLQSFEGGLLMHNSMTQDIYIFLKSQLRL